MDRRTFYFDQPVTESELNGAFDAVEQAIWNIMRDQNLIGIAQNMAGAQASPTPNQTVLVSGPGFAYDPAGERIFTASPNETVDLSKDSNGVVTTVSGAGNEKYISVFVHFTRSLSDPRVDGNSNTVYFIENESHEYIIVQGAEAAVGTATRPALDSTSLLLFDVHRIFGQISFLNADIDMTTRRQDTFVFNQSPLSIRTGTVPLAIQAMLQNLNNHINTVGIAHPANAISTSAHGSGGITVPATNVQASLNSIVDYLNALTVADTAVNDGAHSGTRFSLGAGTLAAQMGSVQSQIDAIMTTGSDSVKQVASIAALKAIGSGSRFANQVIAVLDYGVYMWDPALIAVSDNIFCIRPTDIGSDGSAGRWCSPLRNAVRSALGVAQLDATSRVAAVDVRNGILEAQATNGGVASGVNIVSTATPVLAAPQQVFTLTFANQAKVGDLVLIFYNVSLAIGGTGKSGGSIVSSSENGVVTQLPETNEVCNSTPGTTFSSGFTTRVVGTQGTLIVELGVYCAVTGLQNINLAGQSHLAAILLRP